MVYPGSIPGIDHFFASPLPRLSHLLTHFRRGGVLPRPREGQSPSPTHCKIHFRRGGRLCPPHRTINNAPVGGGVPDAPLYRTPCKTACHCETSDRCHWLWQSVPLWICARVLRMTLLRCPKFLRCLTADAGNFDRGHSLTSLPLPPAALGSLPTTSVRTGLGMTGCKECGDSGRCGERTERCQWQRKRSERVAAVKILSVRRKAAQKFWAPQQDHRPLRVGCNLRGGVRGIFSPLGA